MSTYWGYCCLDCDKETGHWFNHGEDKLREYAEVRQLLAKKNYDWIEVSVTGGEWAIWEMAEFLDDHNGHNIAIKSEYGDVKPLQLSRKPNIAALYGRKAKKMKWISVNERLPEKNSEVLVYTGDGEILMARYLWSKAVGYQGETWLCSYSHNDLSAYGATVTHWQPLPEPPSAI